MALTEEGIIDIPGLHSRWVRLANGERAHYMTAGESGPAVVLLHGGIPGSSGTAGWRMLAPRLANAGFRVYCPDQPGFGLSDPRPEYRPVHGIYSHINFVERFADALCLDRFSIAGNSMGCANTAHYVSRYPHRIERFILIAGPVGDVMPFPTLDRMQVPIGWDGTRETMVKPTSIKAALSTKGRLDTTELPGICLYGIDDVILPVTDLGYQVEDTLTNIQFFYPRDCGHQGQTDQPDLFADVFIEFFRDGIVSRATADRAAVSTRRSELPSLVEQAALATSNA